MSNPWVSRPVVTPAPSQRPSSLVTAPVGPVAPQPSVRAPDAVDRLARRAVTATAAVWWVGVHGGAGESTLAQLVQGSRAAQHAWPQHAGPAPLPVVLVARSSVRGLTAAQRAATEWASGSVSGVDLLGLVISADAPGRLPRPLRDLSTLVAGGVPRMWQLPWIEQWRTDAPSTETLPGSARRALDDIRALLAQPRSI